MRKKRILIFGLGNPGARYENTRHNAGFMVLDEIAKKKGVSITKKKRKALTAEFDTDKRIMLIKPQTYMNNSGECVLDFAAYYKADITDIIIIYDDCDLEPGKIRNRASGSAGSHNGMKSITQALGSEDFARVRIGIGARPEHMELADYVLSKPQGEEARILAQTTLKAADAVLCILEEGIESAQSKYNG